MKKFFISAVSLVLCLSVLTSAFAIEKISPIDDPIQIWLELRNEHYLTVGNDGLLYVEPDNMFTNMSTYPEFLNLIDVCNDSIRDGFLLVDQDTGMMRSAIQFETEVVPYGLSSQNEPNEPDEIIPYNGAHGCSVQALALLQMCQRNYNTLVNYYEEMRQLANIYPEVDPMGMAVAYWIANVRPGGEWDYKVHPNFAPYYTQFCSYFNGNFNHITSEYIGNFNYGYTGSFLYPLTILHLGSYTVSGFDPKDKEDWPAIDAGYQNAP